MNAIAPIYRRAIRQGRFDEARTLLKIARGKRIKLFASESDCWLRHQIDVAHLSGQPIICDCSNIARMVWA